MVNLFIPKIDWGPGCWSTTTAYTMLLMAQRIVAGKRAMRLISRHWYIHRWMNCGSTYHRSTNCIELAFVLCVFLFVCLIERHSTIMFSTITKWWRQSRKKNIRKKSIYGFWVCIDRVQVSTTEWQLRKKKTWIWNSLKVDKWQTYTQNSNKRNNTNKCRGNGRYRCMYVWWVNNRKITHRFRWYCLWWRWRCSLRTMADWRPSHCSPTDSNLDSRTLRNCCATIRNLSFDWDLWNWQYWWFSRKRSIFEIVIFLKESVGCIDKSPSSKSSIQTDCFAENRQYNKMKLCVNWTQLCSPLRCGDNAARPTAAGIWIESLYWWRHRWLDDGIVHFAVIGVAALVGGWTVLLRDLCVPRCLQRYNGRRHRFTIDSRQIASVRLQIVGQ